MKVILWLGIALICYFNAKTTNRRGWLWLIPGICFGYVILIILLFKKKVNPAIEGNTLIFDQCHSRKEKKCPPCARTVLGEVTVCKHCGGDLMNLETSILQKAGEVESERGAISVSSAFPVANILNLNSATEDELPSLPGINPLQTKKQSGIQKTVFSQLRISAGN